MAAVEKIDSNATGLRIAEEQSYKVLPSTPVWNPLEPNSYADFGGQVTTVARRPIDPSRQRKKGVITDLDASGGFQSDLTQTNLEDLLQGYMFADLRPKGEEAVTAVDIDGANPDQFQMASTTGFQVDDLIRGENFAESGNNDVFLVETVNADSSLEVANGSLTDEGSPPADARVVNVGHQFADGEVDIDVTGSLPRLVRASGTKDFTDFGLIAGEWVFLGGDGAAEDFTNAANNGFKRVRSVTVTSIEFDKSDAQMVAETGTSLTVRIFFGRVLKNETGSLIKRRSYQLERQLGAPDDAQPSQIQAEYLVGAVPNEASLNIQRADKITADLSFVAADHETIDGATALKSGTRPMLEENDAFNTTSDFSRIKLARVIAGNEAPEPLFGFAQELTININNNNSPNKAIGTLGAFEVTSGTFEVGGSLTAYFSDVAAINSVRNNTDITIDAIAVKSNAGIAFDIPLITLGDGRANVELDREITLPLDMEAASGAKIDTALDHTLLIVFFDYLPNAADI